MKRKILEQQKMFEQQKAKAAAAIQAKADEVAR